MMPEESFEQTYFNALLNIELALFPAYDDPEMSDVKAQKVIRNVIRTFQAEAKNQAEPTLKLSAVEQTAFDAVYATCHFLMGIGSDDLDVDIMPPKRSFLSRIFRRNKPEKFDLSQLIEPISMEEVVLCLKRIEKSIKRWNKSGGRRGYYNYLKPLMENIT